MADLVKYTVARGHLGDEITDEGMKQKYFEEGETREADPSIVAHLVGRVLIDPNAEKAEKALANKAEKVPENKGATKSPAAAKTPTKGA